jgi:metal-responsive CopG/Arc/MetJ family transcriptional regulator
MSAHKRQVSATLPPELVDELDAIAVASGASRSLLVEQAIRQWIIRQRAKRKAKR